ncbi:MAG: chemotaxis protein CheA [Gammaproteobacteria bacterium]|jgi:two-component system chemotaxis sensor kinase CheA
MSTDLKQFHDAFFEESFEALDDMESGLLNLDIDTFNSAAINTIFRAAHSIKGCSATFGFSEIASFVHLMETALDEMRDGMLPTTQDLVDLLLKSLDTLRNMLSATEAGTPIDTAKVESVAGELKTFLESNLAATADQPPQSVATRPALQSSIGWKIFFRPALDLMKTGNDPLRLIKILSEIGDVETEADVNSVLDFRAIDPEDCYMAWHIALKGEASEAEIREVFEWVEDDCELDIHPITMESLESSEKQAQPKIPNPHQQSPQSYQTDDNQQQPATGTDSVSIRVGIDKVDTIINMVGELVITQSMLDQLGSDIEGDLTDSSMFEKLREGLVQLERNTRELQESVMRIRMLPISYVFNRVPRIVHDLSKKLNKLVSIKMSGEGTELDKTVLEKIGDPLVHLIRNAIDHGIETPEQRRAVGKAENGTIFLNAFHKGGNIIVEIRDDGAGLDNVKIKQTAMKRGLLENTDTVDDQQLFDLIFHPGFSTAEVVSDVSGRGVGMDVVRKNIKSLGGTIEVMSTEGEGTCFTIRLPLTLAILDGQLVRVGNETYIIPLISIIESLQIKPEKINRVGGQAELYQLRDEYISVLRMHELFSVKHDQDHEGQELMVVVEGDGRKVGLVVDDLLSQQQVVIKSLETNYNRVEGISGATILGDGTVALITDITGLIGLSNQNQYVRASENTGYIRKFAAA